MESARAPGFPIWAVGALFVAASIIGVRFTLKNSVDDDYASARRAVTDYERGKNPSTINYRDPLYDDTIRRLQSVPMSSPSAADASRLLAELDVKRRAFNERLRESQERMARTLAEKEAREAQVLAAQARGTGLDPAAAERLQAEAKETPGCQDEERHAHHAAKTTKK